MNLFINNFTKNFNTELKLNNKQEICISCNNEYYENLDNGFLVCSSCGININKVYSNNENTFSEITRETTSCIKIDPLLPKSSMGSYFSGRGYQNIKKLQLWNRITPKERSLYNVFEIIKLATQGTSYDGKITDAAKIYYFKLHISINTKEENKKKDVVSRGNNRMGLIAYCVFLACEKYNVLLILDNLLKMFNITKKIFNCGRKKFNNLIQKYDIDLNNEKNYYSILDYIKRYLNYITFSYEERREILVITKRIIEIGILKNKQPISSASGIIFFMIKHYNKTIDKNYISKISGKSDPTIFKIFNIINENKQYIFPI